MSDIARHNQAGLEINASIESGILNDSVKVAPEIQKALLHAGGALFPTFGATLTSKPLAEFKTHNINLIQSPTQLTGNGAIISCRAYADDGGLGAAFISFAIAKGIVVPISLIVQMGQPAELLCRIFGISSDGDTAPIAVGTTEKALSAHGESHTIGDLGVGGAIAGIQNLNLDFGYQVKTNEGENGKTYPTLAYYDQQQAVLRATTTQLSAATAERLTTLQSTTAITATFRKLQEGGVATDTGKITATIAKALVAAQNVSSGLPYSMELEISPVYDGSGDDYFVWS